MCYVNFFELIAEAEKNSITSKISKPKIEVTEGECLCDFNCYDCEKFNEPTDCSKCDDFRPLDSNDNDIPEKCKDCYGYVEDECATCQGPQDCESCDIEEFCDCEFKIEVKNPEDDSTNESQGLKGDDSEEPEESTEPETYKIPEGYESLADIFKEAIDQAANGKGKVRHANEGERFEDQDIIKICEELGSEDFCLGQAQKKIIESKRLNTEAAIQELLGALNYIAGAIVYLRKN